YFMSHQVQRKIEWCDSRDRADRETLHDAPTAGGRLLPVERQIFAVSANCFFCRDVEGEDGALHFHARAFDGLTRLLRERPGKLVSTILNPVGNAAENALAFERGQAARGSKSLDGGGNGSLGVFAAPLVDVGNHGAVIGSANVED